MNKDTLKDNPTKHSKPAFNYPKVENFKLWKVSFQRFLSACGARAAGACGTADKFVLAIEFFPAV
jgi:hypothetical protein